MAHTNTRTTTSASIGYIVLNATLLHLLCYYNPHTPFFFVKLWIQKRATFTQSNRHHVNALNWENEKEEAGRWDGGRVRLLGGQQ
jgi:hypothetical protein